MIFLEKNSYFCFGVRRGNNLLKFKHYFKITSLEIKMISQENGFRYLGFDFVVILACCNDASRPPYGGVD